MSDVEIVRDDEQSHQPDAAPGVPADVGHDAPPAPPAVLPGSFLGRLQAEREAGLQGVPTKVLLVGASSSLGARYRVLSREEQDQVAARQRRMDNDLKNARGQLSRSDVAVDMAAFTLALACVELVAIEDTRVRPLVEVLAEDGSDTDGDEPLRFDRRTARVLGIDVAERATSAQVCETLHDPHGDATSLSRVASRYSEWVAGAEASALEESLQGS